MNRYRSLKSRSKCALGISTGIMLAACAYASDTDWQMHGALTQGVIYTSDNNFYGNSDDNASLKFTEIDFNASARLRPNLRAAGQVLYRHTGSQSEGGSVDYAFLDYQFFTDPSFISGIRGGRFKVPIGLYNETRDVAFTRPSIYMPQSAYPDTARDLELSSDGALVYGELFTNKAGQWTAEFGVGQPRIDEKTVRSVFGFLPGDISNVSGHTSTVGRLLYQSSGGEWQASFSRSDVRVDYRQALAPMLSTDIEIKLVYWLASLQYSLDQWIFTGEYGQIDARLNSNLFEQGFHPQAYYLQATRRLDAQWSIYTRWDNLYWDRHDHSGNDYAALTGRKAYANFAHDYNLGVRFDVNSNAMISAEYHYIEGTAWLSPADNSALNNAAKYWQMLALEFSYRF